MDKFADLIFRESSLNCHQKHEKYIKDAGQKSKVPNCGAFY